MDKPETASAASSGTDSPILSRSAGSPPGVPRRVPLDLDELPNLLAGARLDHLMLAPSRQAGAHAQIAIPGIQIDHLRFPAAMALRGHWDPDRVSIVLTVWVGDRWITGGMPCQSASIRVCNSVSPLHAYVPAGTEWVVLSVDQARLMEAPQELDGRHQALGISAGIPLHTTSGIAERLLTAVQPLLSCSEGAEDDEAWLTGLVLPAFASALAAAKHTSWPSAVALRRHRLVRLAEAYVRENPFDSIRMQALSRAVGASERLLEYAFREMYGMGAIAFLRAVRFNGARKALLMGDAARTTVTEVAMDWGFSHLSEFAGKYRQLFGELPSHTLHRRPRECRAAATSRENRPGRPDAIKFAALRYSPLPSPHSFGHDNDALLTGAEEYHGGHNV